MATSSPGPDRPAAGWPRQPFENLSAAAAISRSCQEAGAPEGLLVGRSRLYGRTPRWLHQAGPRLDHRAPPPGLRSPRVRTRRLPTGPRPDPPRQQPRLHPWSLPRFLKCHRSISFPVGRTTADHTARSTATASAASPLRFEATIGQAGRCPPTPGSSPAHRPVFRAVSFGRDRRSRGRSTRSSTDYSGPRRCSRAGAGLARPRRYRRPASHSSSPSCSAGTASMSPVTSVPSSSGKPACCPRSSTIGAAAPLLLAPLGTGAVRLDSASSICTIVSVLQQFVAAERLHTRVCAVVSRPGVRFVAGVRQILIPFTNPQLRMGRRR